MLCIITFHNDTYMMQEAMGKVAEAEQIYGKLKEENPSNPVRTASVTVCVQASTCKCARACPA